MPSACGRGCSPGSRPARAIALISDAGTPLISDPGFKLVREALARRAAGDRRARRVGAARGAGAVGPAGRPLPLRRVPAAQERGAAPGAGRARAVPATLIFFESAPRLAGALADMAAVLGDRPAAVARELTKLHEEVRRGALGGARRALPRRRPAQGRDRRRGRPAAATRRRRRRRARRGARGGARRDERQAMRARRSRRRPGLPRARRSMPARWRSRGRAADERARRAPRARAPRPARRAAVPVASAAARLSHPGAALSRAVGRDRPHRAARPACWRRSRSRRAPISPRPAKPCWRASAAASPARSSISSRARPDLAGLELRFDVMLVVPRRLPRHLRDAWRSEG